MTGYGRYCCKSPKLPGDNFPAVRRSDRRPPICVVSITLPRSPVSLSPGDEVPHIFTRKSRLPPREFLITSAKRLLQQYLPKPVVSRCSNRLQGLGGLEIDHQLVLGWCLYRQVSGFLTFKDAIDGAGGAPVLFDNVVPIGDQAEFRFAERVPTLADIARVVGASSRVLHTRDLDERISVENAAVMVLANKRKLVN
jgi:hypothetical protein